MASLTPVQSVHVKMLRNCPPVERVSTSDGGGEPVSLNCLNLGSGTRLCQELARMEKLEHRNGFRLTDVILCAGL